MDDVLYLRIRNWRTFQHYSKRNPPWIKLYHSILDDFDFMSLSETTQAHAFKLYLLACRTENKLPVKILLKNSGFDTSWIAKRISAQGDVDVLSLINAKFLEGYNNEARELLADREQVVSVSREETETETEKRREDKTMREVAQGSDEQIFTEIPTSAKKGIKQFYQVTEKKVRELEEKFPSVDVRKKIWDLCDWSIDHPDRRPSHRGVGAFLSRNIRKDVGKEARRKQIPKWKIEQMQKALRMTHDTILGLTPSDPSYESEFNRILKNCCQDIGVDWSEELEKEARE